MTSRPATGPAATITDRDPADGHLERAERHLREGRLDDAAAGLAAAGDSATARAHVLGGAIAGLRGRHAEAIAAYEQALALDPDHAMARYNLAALLQATGRPEAALATLARLHSADDRVALAAERLRLRLLLALGASAAAAGTDAIADADRAVGRFPDDGELAALRGALLRAAGRPEESLAAQEALLADQPGCLPALCEQGWALLALDRAEAALDAFDQALELDESSVSALTGIGAAEVRLGLLEAALAAFDRARELAPDTCEPHLQHAVTLQLLQRSRDAHRAYETLLQRWPDRAEAWDNLGSILRDQGAIDDALAAIGRALAIEPDRPQTMSNLLLTHLYATDTTLESLAREHAAYGTRFGSPAGRYGDWPNDRDPDRPLRIGFVSAELCRHALTAWLMPALEALDRRDFAVWCYPTRQRQDEVTERIRGLAQGWRDVTGLDDRAMAEAVRADGIDILIDLSGHTGYNRLPVFALKPAPVQATWLGYPFTTGLAAVDYTIMDDVAVRPGEERHFAETVVRLPGGRICYEPPDTAPPVSPPPALTNGWITFGSFNNVAKLTPAVRRTWYRILGQLPTARLILKSPALGNPDVAAALRAEFCGQGFTEGRLELRGPSSQAELLPQYGEVDIALDPFPFNGGVTSCEALWMGLPLVTLRGTLPVARQSETCLAALGRDEWIAADVDDYVAIATRLARDVLGLADRRFTQRDAMAASPLCDKARIGRELNQALRAMWRAFVARG